MMGDGRRFTNNNAMRSWGNENKDSDEILQWRWSLVLRDSAVIPRVQPGRVV